MGDLGYTSSAQDGLQICYNQLETYIETLTKAIVTPYDYCRLPDVTSGERTQLNDYRCKSKMSSIGYPSKARHPIRGLVRALEERGIEYVDKMSRH